jgi:hypothetical protein
LFKNNYYYTLATEFVPHSPPYASCSSHRYCRFRLQWALLCAQCPNCQLQPPGPNRRGPRGQGCPERLVASATLASATALPPPALSGHVMPNFPHTLISLGPFANQDCTIVFTKTAVMVYHPDGHPILSGWQDETAPWLWHFPLTAKATNPQDATGATAPWLPIPTPTMLPAPPPSVTQLPPPVPTVILSAVSVASHPHPSQGVLATNMSGIACLVYYLSPYHQVLVPNLWQYGP